MPAYGYGPTSFKRMHIGKIELPTLEELLINNIEQQIFTGRLRPGDRLPSERQLQEETGISKTVVHAGLVALEKKGLIEIKPRSGAYVTDYTSSGTLEALNALIRHNGGMMTKKQAESFFEFRIAVEGIALKKVAERHTDEALERLEELLAQAEALARSDPGDVSGLALLLFTYHRCICSYCGNEFFPLLMNEFKPIILRFWEDSVSTFGAEKNVRLARRFLGDIRRGDCDAAYRRLVRSSTEYISRYK